MSDLIRKQKQNPNIPAELIVEILLKLPVKSLLRFRSVSKSWLSLISDPHFAKSHFDRGAAPSYRLFYLTAPGSKALSIDLDASLHDDSADVQRVLKVPKYFSAESHEYRNQNQILGSCRGFILLQDHPHLRLLNPNTGAHKLISYSATAFDLYKNSRRRVFACGLGYDASTDNYLVVLASHDPWGDIQETNFEYMSLRTNSWEKIECGRRSLNLDKDQSALLFNGALHWLATCEPSEVQVIIAFDLMERNLFEIPVPASDDYNDWDCELSVLGEFLSLCSISYSTYIAEIWVMKEYKVQSSWTKSIVLSTSELLGGRLIPFCFTKSGEIVGFDENGGLVRFNHKGEQVEHLEFRHTPCIAGMYTESLLSLPSDCGDGGKDN